MKTDFEYIVIGLGGLGSAAAFWLARRAGREVLALEQFELGHVHGESQDHSRIIRLSYHTSQYVKLAQHAYRTWQVVESESGEKLIIKTGGLDLWPPGGIIPMADYTSSLQSWGVPFEILDSSEIMRRYPQFRLDSGIVGLFQADGGIAAAAKCTHAHQRLAREYGATIRDHALVSAIRKSGEEYIITAGGNTYRCRRLVIAAGPWSNQALGHFGLQLPLTITQEQVVYYSSPHLIQFLPDRFPVWIWMDEPCYYGFPVYGEPAIKIGQDVGGKEVTTATRTYETDQDALQRVQGFLEKYIPSSVGSIHYVKSCLYTLTPDRDFVLDELPNHPGCFVAIGAGHAYKFASVIGRTLSELAIDDQTQIDISPFRVNRDIMLMENPPKNFMT